jgi:hypothetical protein
MALELIELQQSPPLLPLTNVGRVTHIGVRLGPLSDEFPQA